MFEGKGGGNHDHLRPLESVAHPTIPQKIEERGFDKSDVHETGDAETSPRKHPSCRVSQPNTNAPSQAPQPPSDVVQSNSTGVAGGLEQGEDSPRSSGRLTKEGVGTDAPIKSPPEPKNDETSSSEDEFVPVPSTNPVRQVHDTS